MYYEEASYMVMTEEISREDVWTGIRYLTVEAINKKYGDFEAFEIEEVLSIGKAYRGNDRIDFNVNLKVEKS
jgi:hypothetical protein